MEALRWLDDTMEEVAALGIEGRLERAGVEVGRLGQQRNSSL